ncbi:CDP-glucose 4,6-dehydratase [Rhizobium leguminosarum]|uniref:CDP-glucose 4,6-dehydratase n=1 Tax=Rhizobium leguminosarum TaxID=384 RepID=A0AAJ1A999_RHILE|nr:CDP-glucose 4,6-dehydratase [Rhizobium leguminosarum]MBY5534700.1 CDP-glucose 4,6-dehydratase [Rhizobium leguminosarum]MBY5596170.1 CDP-glucose 4,6-dehydratase [Rhizobium leguminosarum]MBY5617040.1 CDP-glucose 4,6-dehydratase [Rhizobium leguminosarum]MBY5629465.1 CDP-glucose 4,6-dehydratase [Rhizobium leguminosarum]MBY5730250.1 CDP-glucose 4,6-dehydratase [Rhizobium leguminosarum]
MGLTDFWNGRRVFLTGHTGFKGSWLSLWLEKLGAEVTAVSLEPETNPSLYGRLAPWNGQGHYIADIREAATFKRHFIDFEPEIVIHMAAQALVRRSYENPTETFATNVLGTANILDAVRETPSVKTTLVVTSDKVYANNGSGVPFVETDMLGGKDPYSNSKACTELVVQSYRDSFFKGRDIRLATVRAGNVIGGGDWSKDRLIPDFIRAFESNQPILLRYPEAIRPWQHVLEPLGGYLAFAEALTLAGEQELPEALNFGPDPQSFATVCELAEALGLAHGVNDVWKPAPGKHLPEAPALTLSSALAFSAIGWRPRLGLKQTIDWTAAWYKANREGADMRAFSLGQIAAYEETVS